MSAIYKFLNSTKYKQIQPATKQLFTAHLDFLIKFVYWTTAAVIIAIIVADTVVLVVFVIVFSGRNHSNLQLRPLSK